MINKNKIEIFTNAAILACLEAINKGWSITQGVYGYKSKKECCPITALGLFYSEDIWVAYGELCDLWKITCLINENLGIFLDIEDRYAFVQGFDDIVSVKYTNSSWRKAGTKVAEVLKSEALLAKQKST